MEYEKVRITAVDKDDNATLLIVPAYTVEPEALFNRVKELLGDYILESGRTGEQLTSLGDFALYVLAAASQDPASDEEVEKRKEANDPDTNYGAW